MFTFQFRKHRSKLIIRDNCHPLKSTFVLYFQLPMWITLSFALRGLTSGMPFNDAGLINDSVMKIACLIFFFFLLIVTYLSRHSAAQFVYTQLSVGGMLWIPNLTIPDGSFILPLLLVLVNLTNIEVSIEPDIRFDFYFSYVNYVTIRFTKRDMAIVKLLLTWTLCF